jgi:hypothetical protein
MRSVVFLIDQFLFQFIRETSIRSVVANGFQLSTVTGMVGDRKGIAS